MSPAKRSAAPEGEESWEDFKAAVLAPVRTQVIEGVRVVIPRGLPLNFMDRLNALSSSEDERDVHELVGRLFGEGVLQQWIDVGLTAIQFNTLLVWGIAQANGVEMSFREAYAAVLAKDGEEGKAEATAANRATRRAATRSQSAAGGGRSKPISAASTASRRRTSGT
ncbi:hypothetical protein [Streptomyces sp. URMC 129]|uniref:hypothetical protein n=1 Tax=Streptomyces sp. URMC 129 TaxID=3423407 RepID=UPI003F1BE0E7